MFRVFSELSPKIRGVTLALLAVGLLGAIWQRWLCDDAFVSFRYAEHLVDGHGLVWNHGERVEGMTNLAWTLLLAAGVTLGADPGVLSMLLGIASYLLVLLLVLQLEVRSGSHWPMATWILSLTPDLWVWASGGLETMTVTAAALAVMVVSRGAPSRTLVVAGVLAGLCFGLRPDGALLAGILLLGGVASCPHTFIRGAVSAFVPFVAIVLAVTAFRMLYYGEVVPNTYFAKDAGHAWWDQGLSYLGLTLARNHVLIWLGLAAMFVGLRKPGEGSVRSPAGVALVAAAVFTLYVVRSGGDFMHARRLIPVLPLVVFGCVQIVRPTGAAAVALCLAAVVPYPLYSLHGDESRINGVANEPAFYPPERIDRLQEQGAALGAAFAGTPATFLLPGGLNILAHASKLPTFIEVNGLMDPVIARAPKTLDTPGHLKEPPAAYLDERRVEFQVLPDFPGGAGRFDLVEVDGGTMYLGILRYVDEVMDPLGARPGVTFVPIDTVLSQIEGGMDTRPCNVARAALAHMDGYYFRWNPAAAPRRAALVAAVDARCEGQGEP